VLNRRTTPGDCPPRAQQAKRAMSARLAHQINEVHARQLDLKRQIWEQEMEEARLRSPARK
jgi:hypothetical protein